MIKTTKELILEEYEKNLNKYLRTAFKITKNMFYAEDATQNAFIAAIDQADSFIGTSALNTWLHAIVKNQSVNLIRKLNIGKKFVIYFSDIRKTSDGGILDTIYDNFSANQNPEELKIKADDHRNTLKELHQAINKLTPAEQKAVRLHYLEGLRWQEASKRLGCSHETVKVSWRRGLINMKRIFKEKNIDSYFIMESML